MCLLSILNSFYTNKYKYINIVQDVRLLSLLSQLSSGVMRLGFDLKVIYFHALIIKK